MPLKKFALIMGLVAVGGVPSALRASEDGGALKSVFETIHSGFDLLLPEDMNKHGWKVRIGAGFGALPDYKGSNDYRLKLLPIIDIRYGNRLRLNYNKLLFAALKTGSWEVGPLVKYKTGRRERRNEVLFGLGNISPTVQLGLYANYKTKHMLFNVEYRHALSEKVSGSVSATLGHAIYKTGKLGFAIGLQGKWLSKKAMQTFYGVTEEQAEKSKFGLAVFKPNAGVSDVSLNLLAKYDVSKGYRLLGLAKYGRLMGNAAQSPFVAGGNGSRNQLTLGVGFTLDL